MTEGEKWNIIKGDYLRINTWTGLAPRAEGPADKRLYLLHRMIRAQTAQPAGELLLWGNTCVKAPRTAPGFTSQATQVVINSLKQTEQLTPTLSPHPTGRWLLHSVSDAVLQGWICLPVRTCCVQGCGSSMFSLKHERAFRKRKQREMLLAACCCPCSPRGLLASHNGGSQGAPYLSAAGRFQQDKTAIHVCGSRQPPLWHMSLCVISCSTRSTESPSMGSL